ncbi:MAG: hypothetical protein IPL16_12030 [Ignavibacteria bacterium]|nr:hypothetical protein [Ignavibacteria bacterium]
MKVPKPNKNERSNLFQIFRKIFSPSSPAILRIFALGKVRNIYSSVTKVMLVKAGIFKINGRLK